MSRPNSSAPSRYLAPGRARFSIRLWRVGSWTASHGARVAVSTSTRTSARPIRARRFLRKRIQASTRVFGSALLRDARVEEAVGQIDDQVDDDEGQGEDEHGALQEDVVAGEDRLDHETAEPRPREDRLGEHGAAHELARLQPEQRDERGGGVAERVPAEHPPLAHALGPGG